MKFKLDENLPTKCAEILRAAGHDAVSVMDQGLGGAADPQISQICTAEGRVLVSLDLDFADIRTYPPSKSAGIILFRLKSQDVPVLCSLTRRLLKLLETESPAEKLWIVEEDKVRVRE